MEKKFIEHLTEAPVFNKVLFHKKGKNSHLYFINIHPRSIINIGLLPECSPSLIGESAYHGVYGGMWDMLKYPFKKNFMYGTVACILKGEKFKKSPLYKKVQKKKITEEEAVIQYEKLKRQVKNLTESGYLSQYELKKLDEKISIGHYQVPRHEIIVGLGRRGQFIRLAGGRHRLAIAQQIGIESMPAILSLVHNRATGMLPERKRIITGLDEDYSPF